MHYNLSDEQKIFLHVSYSMLEEGYDVDQIIEFWNLDDESKALEIYESITLSETIDTSNPDFLLICEKGGIQGFLMRLLGRGGRGVKVKPPATRPPASAPAATTRGGRPITSSAGRGTTKPDATKPPVSGGQPPKPTLVQRVKDKIPPAMKDKIRQGAATALTTGALFGGAALLMNKGDIPGIPDAPEPQPSKPEESGKDPLANDSTDTSTDSSSSTDSTSSSTTSDTRAERKRRNYAWASINNRPKNFYRNDPAYYHTKSKYNNIRGNPIPKEYRDHYEVIADYLIAEGHASDIEDANYVMQQLDEDFIRSIIENK
jgi:Ni/Co efflux regulator RcnB